MSKNKRVLPSKGNEKQLSINFSFSDNDNEGNTFKIQSSINTKGKIVSIKYFEENEKRELLKHIIHNETSF